MTALNDAAIIDARHEIDRIDAEICTLVNQRIIAARRVQAVRVDERDEEREAKVISRYMVRIVSRGPAVRELAQKVIEACRLR